MTNSGAYPADFQAPKSLDGWGTQQAPARVKTWPNDDDAFRSGISDRCNCILRGCLRASGWHRICESSMATGGSGLMRRFSTVTTHVQSWSAGLADAPSTPLPCAGLDVALTYARFGPMVLRRCRRLLDDDDEADDAMHDVFAALVKRQSQTHSGGMSSLLYTMATHTCLDRLRRRRRRPFVDNRVLDELAALDDGAERSVVRNVLDVLFAREPASTRVMAARIRAGALGAHRPVITAG